MKQSSTGRHDLRMKPFPSQNVDLDIATNRDDIGEPAGDLIR